MKLTFRTIVVGVIVVGLGFGASFGAGIAYGRGTPKTAAAAPTQQQLNQQLGVTGSGATGSPQALATQVAGGGQRGAAQTAGRAATGRITAIEGNTITIETAQGSQKINVSPGATLEKVAQASLSDFKVGDSVVASGTRNNDGSFEASAVSQVPQGLGILGGQGGTQPVATPSGR